MSSVLLFGRVVSTKDPDSIGRIQVETVGFGRSLVLPWARVLQPTASNKIGTFFLPEEGDEVVVLRGLGERPEGMVVLGALYHAKRPPKTPDSDGKNNTKEIRTRAGHAITFVDKEGSESVTLTSGDGKLSLMLDQHGGTVTLSGDKEIKLVSNSKVTVTAKEVAITGTSKIELKSDSSVKLTGGDIELSGQKVKIS